MTNPDAKRKKPQPPNSLIAPEIAVGEIRETKGAGKGREVKSADVRCILLAPDVLLKVSSLVDRDVVALESALERRRSNRVAGVGLLGRAAWIVHQVVALYGLLATPDSPRNESQTPENDGPTDTNHDANNDIACLRRHAGGRAIAAGEAGGRSARLLGCDGCLLSVGSSCCDDLSNGGQDIGGRRLGWLRARIGRGGHRWGGRLAGTGRRSWRGGCGRGGCSRGRSCRRGRRCRRRRRWGCCRRHAAALACILSHFDGKVILSSEFGVNERCLGHSDGRETDGEDLEKLSGMHLERNYRSQIG